MSVSENDTGLPKRKRLPQSPLPRLRRCLSALPPPSLLSLSGRAGVPMEMIRRARGGSPVSAENLMRLLRGLGIDPTNGTPVEVARGHCSIEWGLFGTAVFVTRAYRTMREAADEARVSPASIVRAEQGGRLSFKSFRLLCIWLGQPPSDFVSVDFSREAGATP